MANKAKELRPEQLRWTCDPRNFKFKTTADLVEKAEIIGQEKALKAMRTGLSISSPGFNVFVAGLSGTGKMTTIKFILERLKVANSLPTDKCYIHNFKMPDMPRMVELPAGEGKKFLGIYPWISHPGTAPRPVLRNAVANTGTAQEKAMGEVLDKRIDQFNK